MNSVESNNISLKIQKFTPSGYKDIGAVFDFFPLKMLQKITMQNILILLQLLIFKLL